MEISNELKIGKVLPFGQYYYHKKVRLRINYAHNVA